MLKIEDLKVGQKISITGEITDISKDGFDVKYPFIVNGKTRFQRKGFNKQLLEVAEIKK